MKKIIFLLLMCILCFSCSQENIASMNGTLNMRKKVIQHQSFYFPLSFEEQDELVRDFSEICAIDGVNDFLLSVDDVALSGERCHALMNAENEDAQENFDKLSAILEENDKTQFRESIEQLCTNNYLNFNVYIPHYEEVISSYHQGVSIYVVNALYSDALAKSIKDYDVEGLPIYEYKVSFVISNGGVYPSDLMIDENFCKENIVYFVTFRDEIVNWNHFAKGTQSISDWLITTAVEYKGYGCFSPTELIEDGCAIYGQLTIPILHSKKTFRKPCDEKYDRFCKFGKPEELEFNTELEALYELDPYRTSWMIFDHESNDQYIEIKSNSLGLDLEGHDFYVHDTILILDEGVIRIPAQISTYDPERDAQRIEMEYIAG